jgi:hypothetical protein
MACYTLYFKTTQFNDLVYELFCMKTLSKKSLILLVITLASNESAHAQFFSRDYLFVGKRGNVVWDRKISVVNMGNEKWNFYYPIYFKTSVDTNWKKTGILGSRIKPLLNESALPSFESYRRKKLISYYLLGVSVGSLMSWAYYTSYKMVETNSLKAYIHPVSLLLLGSYVVCFEAGKKVNVRGDIFLVKAVMAVNAQAGENSDN